MAYEVLSLGGDSGAVFNAADEVMTERFLDGDVRFPDIVDTVSTIVRNRDTKPLTSRADVEAADAAAREAARQAVPTRA